MSKVVLDVSMSLDGFTARPNMREPEPMGTAANASTPGWPATGPTARSMSPCAEHWTPVWRRGHRQAHLGSRCRPWGGTPWSGVPGVVVTHRRARTCSASSASTWLRCCWMREPTVRWGEQAELIPAAKPVTGTHLHYRVRY